MMMPLQAAGDAALTWEQTDRRGKRLALRAGGATVATLDLPRVWHTTAQARTADGAWELQRAGFARPRLDIRAAGTTEVIATFAGVGHGQSQVTLSDGRLFRWHPARHHGKDWTFGDETGHAAVTFTDANERAGAYHFTVQLTAALREESAGVLLATLGMYLIVETVTAAMIAAVPASSAGT